MLLCWKKYDFIHSFSFILFEILSHTPRYQFFQKFVSIIRAGNLVTTFGAIGPKMVYLTLLWSNTFNFHKQPLILFEILFCTPSCQFVQKFGFMRGLELSYHFQGNWAQNGLPDITLEPHIRFSQTTAHFVWNFVLHISCHLISEIWLYWAA